MYCGLATSGFCLISRSSSTIRKLAFFEHKSKARGGGGDNASDALGWPLRPNSAPILGEFN